MHNALRKGKFIIARKVFLVLVSSFSRNLLSPRTFDHRFSGAVCSPESCRYLVIPIFSFAFCEHSRLFLAGHKHAIYLTVYVLITESNPFITAINMTRPNCEQLTALEFLRALCLTDCLQHRRATVVVKSENVNFRIFQHKIFSAVSS